MFNRGGKPMRLFFAIELSDAAREEISRAVWRLRRDMPAAGPAGKWTASGLYHLTVQFLGEYPASLLPDLQEVLAGAAVGVPPFPLCFESWGVFGRSREILWLGVAAQPDLTRLAGQVAGQLRRRSLPFEDRPYQPHLTIGRQLEPDPLWLGRQPQPAVSMQVERVSLMESVRVGGRLVYRPLFRQPLQKGP